MVNTGPCKQTIGPTVIVTLDPTLCQFICKFPIMTSLRRACSQPLCCCEFAHTLRLEWRFMLRGGAHTRMVIHMRKPAHTTIMYNPRVSSVLITGCWLGLAALVVSVQEYHFKQCADPSRICVYGDGSVAIGINRVYFTHYGIGGGVACPRYDDTLRTDLVWATDALGTTYCHVAQIGIPTTAVLCILVLAMATLGSLDGKDRWSRACWGLAALAATAYLACAGTTLWFYHHSILEGMNLPADTTRGNLLVGGYLLIASSVLVATGLVAWAYSIKLPGKNSVDAKSWMRTDLF